MKCSVREAPLRAVSAILVLAAAMLLPLAAGRARAAPFTGTYKSDDMDGGVFLTGRWSEGFVNNDPDHVGNGAHAGSWDGAALYGDWELQGPTLLSTAVDDNRVGGTGTLVARRDFDTTGATLTLASGMPWTGPGDGAYTFNLTLYEQTVTALYVAGVPTEISSTETYLGTLAGDPTYQVFGQAAGAYVGQDLDPTPGGLPAGFPDWIPAGAPSGAWGEVGLVRFTITPEPATLLLVGAGLGGVWLMRRRR